MKGLICRDLLICYRRTSKSNYVTDILFFSVLSLSSEKPI